MKTRKNIEQLPKTSCTGCKMCADICPSQCIQFAEDEEGFFYPTVDDERCIDCGRCLRNCPAKRVMLHPRVCQVQSAYASQRAIHDSGSSGGLFYLFAETVLNEGGVVYGASFDKNLLLKHRRAEKQSELRSLCKSKYVQSDCSGIYLQVKTDLQSGKTVLFSGTPCQCQALHNFIGEKMANHLVLVDFVCHGVPNQHLFDDNIQWNARKYGNIRSIEFRHKGGPHPQMLKMVYEKDGKEKTCLRLHYQDPYYFGFQKHLTMRPSCYECLWAKPERCSDITIADFWGIEKLDKGLDSKKGVSCIAPNTEKGKSLFQKIRPQLSGVFSIPIEFAIANNECLGNSTRKPENRSRFFEDWIDNGYDYVVEKYLTPKRKLIFDIYYAIPGPVRKIVRKLMDNRMKYE